MAWARLPVIAAVVVLLTVPPVADETLGRRIRRLREAHGMSQPVLAAAMRARGARTQAHDIPKYERDTYDPTLRAFATLAHVFGISMELLLYGEDEAARIAAEHEGAGVGQVSAGG